MAITTINLYISFLRTKLFYTEIIIMYKNKRILAFIPARGGSKGLPNKNILDLCGKPLLCHSIDVAKNCSYIDDIIVSTDSSEIKDIAEFYGATVPFLRPDELSSDTATIIDAMFYTLQRLMKEDVTYDYIMLLQPTQPLRKAEFLEEAIELIIDNDHPSLVSVSPVLEHPILMRTVDKTGALCSLLSTSSTVRRQDFSPVYKVNGSIYINRIDSTFTNSTSLNDNLYPYFMDNTYDIDIDSAEDLEKAREVLSSLA